jgi:hypothetical protein
MESEKRYLVENISDYKRGLSRQREIFKAAKDGTGINNFDQMCDSLENIKSDIKSKTCNYGNSYIIDRVEKIIDWYRTIEERYTINTPEGKQVKIPYTLYNKVSKNLTIAYELLLEQQDILDLL